MSDHNSNRPYHTPLPEPRNIGRGGQLRIALSMKDAGHIYQALGVLNTLLEDYPHDPESVTAAEEIASIAREFEHRGLIYTALDLYQQLERLQ